MTHKHSWVVIAMIIALCVGMTPGVSAVTLGPFPASGAGSINISTLLFPLDTDGEWTPNPAIGGELAAPGAPGEVSVTIVNTLIGNLTQILAIQFMPFALGGPSNPLQLAIPPTSTIDGITIAILAKSDGSSVLDYNVDLIFGADAANVTILNSPKDIDPLSPTFDAGSPLNSTTPYTSGFTFRTYGSSTDDLTNTETSANSDNTPAGGMVEAVRSPFLGWVITAVGAAGDLVTVDFASITIDFTPGPPSVDTFTSNGDGTFALEFFHDVSGVDTADFSVLPGSFGGDATGTISGVTGSGSSYVVTVGSLSGDGFLTVLFTAAGSGVTDDVFSLTITADKTSTALLEGVNPLPSIQVPFFETK